MENEREMARSPSLVATERVRNHGTRRLGICSATHGEVITSENMIFVGGIHGVGKTTVCKVIQDEFQIDHYSASTLVANAKREELGVVKQVADIETNQDFLTRALRDMQIGSRWFLLDGHFCLINTRSQITRVPEDTFRQLAPRGIISIQDTVNEIKGRLLSRDNLVYDELFLEQFQDEELCYAVELANMMNIPHVVFHANERQVCKLEEFLRTVGAIV
jgi:adenylate kinase